MCGRFILTAPGEIVAEAFDLDEVPSLEPRYNIAPTQPVAVVHLVGAARKLDLLAWGLGGEGRFINARAETLASRPTFREAFARGRCLVPADGFYEWWGEGRGRKPYLIRRADQRVFAFAGLFESTPEGGSCTIITTPPNTLVGPIHDRMPAILAREAYASWLDPRSSLPAVKALLVPSPPEPLEAFVVSREVNDPRHEGPRLILPATLL